MRCGLPEDDIHVIAFNQPAKRQPLDQLACEPGNWPVGAVHGTSSVGRRASVVLSDANGLIEKEKSKTAMNLCSFSKSDDALAHRWSSGFHGVIASRQTSPPAHSRVHATHQRTACPDMPVSELTPKHDASGQELCVFSSSS